MEAAFGFEVRVKNDARAMVIGEAWLGNHTDTSNMLVINFGYGVGTGMVVDGQLYHGSSDIAGEAGHMTIDCHGDLCDGGNKGCLQTIATGKAIARRSQETLPVSERNTALTGKDVYELALAGKARYIDVLEETGSIMVVA